MSHTDALIERSERDSARGADVVFDAARLERFDEHEPSRRSMWIATAAAIVAIVSGAVWFAQRPGDSEQLRSADGRPAVENRWTDDFDRPSGSLSVDDEYRVVTRNVEASVSVAERRWNVEMTTQGGFGGVLVGPNRVFEPIDGRVRVTLEVAAGVPEHGQTAWPEIIVSAAPSPDDTSAAVFMGADWFSDAPTIGCRLETGGNTTCQLNDADGSTVWVASWFEHVGTRVVGGNTFGPQGDAFRTCSLGGEPTDCLDRFQLELTRNELSIFVNDELYFRQSGLPDLPPGLIDGPISVWAGSMTGGQEPANLRFDWDRFIVG